MATPSDSRATALRPLAGPAWGAVAAAGALTTVLLGRLSAHWEAYQALAAYAGGVQSADLGGALYDTLPGPASLLQAVVFGAFLACLATWVLRARRNARALRPDHPFRFSPAGAVAGVLVPLGNLWLAGPVVTEIADVTRPAPGRGRHLPERGWWICGQVAAGALVAASVAVAWTPLARQGPVTVPPPTPRELTAQLAVALLNGVAVAALAAMTAMLAVTLTRIARDQRRGPAASAPEVGEPPVVPRRGLAAGALVGATTATAALLAMTGDFVVKQSGFAWASTLANPYTAGIVVIPATVLAVYLAQIGALGLATVRFARRRRGSAVALTATACAVAWARLLLGPPPAQEFVASLWWANRGAALVCIGTALLVVAAVRRPATAG